MRDDVRKNRLQVVLGSPADRRVNFLDRRGPVEHVLDPEAVDAVVRNEADLRSRARESEHAICEIDDPDALRRAHVEDLSRRGRRVHQLRQRPHRVLHVAEAARLRAVTMHLEGLVCECRRHEPRDDHPVLAALARADGVEQPDDDAVEVALPVVCECEMLVHRLRVGIEPATGRRRAVDPPVVLVERPLLTVIAVDLGARRDQDALAEAARVIEHGLGALDVRHHGPDRVLDDEPHADRRREVIDDVALVDQLVDDGGGEDRVDDEVEGRVLA